MLTIDHLTTYYEKQEYGFDFRFKAGGLYAITGPSGIGKSTLLHMIAGFAPIASGQVIFKGQNFTQMHPSKRPVSLLFQQHNLFEHLTVRQNIALGLSRHLWRLSEVQRQQIDQMLEELQLSHKAHARPAQLSGGQAQRAALGRILLRKKSILLLDEPFSALDPTLRQELMQLTYSIHKQHRLTTLIVSHHPEEVHDFADEMIAIGV